MQGILLLVYVESYTLLMVKFYRMMMCLQQLNQFHFQTYQPSAKLFERPQILNLQHFQLYIHVFVLFLIYLLSTLLLNQELFFDILILYYLRWNLHPNALYLYIIFHAPIYLFEINLFLSIFLLLHGKTWGSNNDHIPQNKNE